ncbi:unnamed protein product [Didymodactylos carnosus]|uniref:Uncharacterized protein n=2 Tax=Didymodactylos carnosus TaxID=1234261 RepID=A0A8S2YZQ0_9BILA|nr:unnamed protein product [Didymodactylos carnosus]
MWNDESDINECTFSVVVQCQKMPVSIALSSSTCLAQLLNDDTLTPSICQVIPAQDMQQGVMQIVNGIQLLYNIREINYCQGHSTSNELGETIPINEPAILRTL